MKVKDSYNTVQWFNEQSKPTIKNLNKVSNIQKDSVEITCNIVPTLKDIIDSLPDVRDAKITSINLNIDIEKIIDKLLKGGIII